MSAGAVTVTSLQKFSERVIRWNYPLFDPVIGKFVKIN